MKVYSREKLLETIASQERVAAGNFTFQHTVGLVFRKEERFPIASGVLISIKDKKFIITAAHNLNTALEDLFIISHDSPNSQTPKILRVGKSDRVDIGYLEINISEMKEFKRSFLTLDDCEFDYFSQAEDWLCITGFLDQMKSIKVNQSLKVFWFEGSGLTIWCDPIDFEKWRIKDLKKEDHLILKYPQEGLIFERNIEGPPPHPGGLSGGGIWKVPINPDSSGEIWHTGRVKLVGIEHGWAPDYKQISGSKIKAFLELINRDYPKLIGD